MPLVTDTTALRYLIEIDAVHLLPVLFEHTITLPEADAELQRRKRLRRYVAGWPPLRYGSRSGS